MLAYINKIGLTHLIAVHNIIDDLRFVGGDQQGTQTLLQTTAGLNQWLHHDITILKECL